MTDRHDQRDRRNDQDQVRDDKAGNADEDENRLAAIGHQVDVAQRLGDPDDRRQADEHQKERTERGAENINANRPHPPAPSPVAQPRGAPDPRPAQRFLNKAVRSPAVLL
jgi:hypothetical protein